MSHCNSEPPFSGSQLHFPGNQQMWHEKARLPGALSLAPLLQPWTQTPSKRRKEPGKGPSIIQTINTDLLDSPGKATQHSAVTFTGNELEEEWIIVSIYAKMEVFVSIQFLHLLYIIFKCCDYGICIIRKFFV